MQLCIALLHNYPTVSANAYTIVLHRPFYYRSILSFYYINQCTILLHVQLCLHTGHKHCTISTIHVTGTMGHDDPPGSGKFLPNLGSLYSQGGIQEAEIKKHLGDLTISNGLAWSSDGRTMFFIDTVPRKLYAFDYDQQAGTIGIRVKMIVVGAYIIYSRIFICRLTERSFNLTE